MLMFLVVTTCAVVWNGGTSSVVAAACDSTTNYLCSNKKCIARALVNNSINDCGDNSDEAANPCRYPLFSCLNDRCIMMDDVMDGNNDCIDKSDEAKLIGSPCHMAISCCYCSDFVPHSECRSGFCRCIDSYYANQLGTRCQRRIIGSPCRVSAECRQSLANSWCQHDDDTDNGTSIDGTMTSSSEDRRHCACRDGFRPSPDGTYCDDQSLTRDIAVVAVCVFLVALFVLIDGFLIFWLCRAFICRYHASTSSDYDDWDSDDSDESGDQRRERQTAVILTPCSTGGNEGYVRRPAATWRELVGVWKTTGSPSDRNMNRKQSKHTEFVTGNGIGVRI